jgi:1-piperideine-2-carboxylate/1-pyrroline-2-carboxylate reductase [NAD(P)H]
MKIIDAQETAKLLPFRELVDEVAKAAVQYERGEIACPPRHVLPLAGEGAFLSMPATAADIGVHKLVTVQPRNRELSLPTIHGVITVVDGVTGAPVCLLDARTVTGRRTAAVTMLAIEKLRASASKRILLIGTGSQAAFHVQAIRDVFPACEIVVKGRTPERAQAFCAASNLLVPASAKSHDGIDVVIAVTTSTAPVYNEPARADRLVIGVGAYKAEMAEIGAITLRGSAIYTDDPAGARHEAGDLIQAGVNWDEVKSLAAIVRGDVDANRPSVFKSVGSAAWDLAACRLAMQRLRA